MFLHTLSPLALASCITILLLIVVFTLHNAGDTLISKAFSGSLGIEKTDSRKAVEISERWIRVAFSVFTKYILNVLP